MAKTKYNTEHISAQIAKYFKDNPEGFIEALVRLPWPHGLKADEEYFIREDDCDGINRGIGVSFSKHPIRSGDLWFEFYSRPGSYEDDGDYGTSENFCFRSFFGGGRKPLVNKAAIFLAYAIAMAKDEVLDHKQLHKEYSDARQKTEEYMEGFVNGHLSYQNSAHLSEAVKYNQYCLAIAMKLDIKKDINHFKKVIHQLQAG